MELEGTVTLAELQELLNDIKHAPGCSSAIKVDNIWYKTDWGYAIEGIEHFINMIKYRHDRKTNANSFHSGYKMGKQAIIQEISTFLEFVDDDEALNAISDFIAVEEKELE